MNREIKFRGRNPLTKQWEYGFLITVDLSSEKLSKNLTAIIKENAWYEPSEGIGGFKLVEPQSVGQFTGLCDENDKQIYEGDLLDLDGMEDEFEYIKVEYDDGRFVANWYGDVGYNTESGFEENGGPIELCDTEDLREYSRKVIGNIHDNPEMLEVEMNES